MLRVINKGKEECLALNDEETVKIISSKENGNSVIVKNKNGTLIVSNEKGRVTDVKKRFKQKI